MKVVSIAVLLATCGVNGFTVVKPHHRGVITTPTSSSSALNLNLPRLTLPDAVGEKLESLDLKNPNDMDEDEYDAYSGAAIGGTLLTFLVPGALVSGIFGAVSALVTGILFNFVFSALIGGGLGIYLSVRTDEIGQTIRSNGYGLYQSVKSSGLPVIPRLSLPDLVDDKLEEFDLMSINDMDDDDYDGYSGAAVAGTALFFLLSFVVSGILSTVTEELLPSIVGDLLFSAVVGGGAAIYLSLRKDEIGDTVGGLGTKFLSVVDETLESKGAIEGTKDAEIDTEEMIEKIRAPVEEEEQEVRKTAGI